MKLTAGNPEELDLIPEGEVVNVILIGVDPNEFEFKGEQIVKLRWSFAVSDPGNWQGKTITGDTSKNFTAHPNCKAYNLAIALTGKEYPVGAELDTDDIIGLPARIIIQHKPGKDGRLWMRAREVLKAQQGAPEQAPSEAPF